MKHLSLSWDFMRWIILLPLNKIINEFFESTWCVIIFIPPFWLFFFSGIQHQNFYWKLREIICLVWELLCRISLNLFLFYFVLFYIFCHRKKTSSVFIPLTFMWLENFLWFVSVFYEVDHTLLIFLALFL